MKQSKLALANAAAAKARAAAAQQQSIEVAMMTQNQAAALRSQQQQQVAQAMHAHAQSQYLEAARAGRLGHHAQAFSHAMQPPVKRQRHVPTMDMGDAMFDGWMDSSMGRDGGPDTALDAALFDGQVRAVLACSRCALVVDPHFGMLLWWACCGVAQDLFASELFASMGVDDDGRGHSMGGDYLAGDVGFSMPDMHMGSAHSATSSAGSGRTGHKPIVTATATGYKAMKAERRAARPKRSKANGCVGVCGAPAARVACAEGGYA